MLIKGYCANPITLELVNTVPVILPKVSRPNVWALYVVNTAYRKARNIVNEANATIWMSKFFIKDTTEKIKPNKVVIERQPVKPNRFTDQSINGTQMIPAGST